MERKFIVSIEQEDFLANSGPLTLKTCLKWAGALRHLTKVKVTIRDAADYKNYKVYSSVEDLEAEFDKGIKI